jgi:small ligand-binding sensory domain FIST
MDSDGGRPDGLPIIAAEPDELKVVDIQGAAPLARFEELVRSAIRFDLKSLTGSNAAGSTLTSGFSAR